ncbi:hypothetical protein [Flagellimonas beolgyonensis]|jgi:hypothetical protein|uniref:hypothetical protein n=1 Tax=Flagellimonas beolgyonensis TaxID=864064 RepID=UPI000F8D47EC|nr:hypothetical protein [Allomuricauda beolgyonensis]
MNKKRIIFSVLAVFAFCISVTAQYVDRSSTKVGVMAGIPMGDLSDFSKIALGVDVAFHWGVSELFDVGIATGFINAFGETDSATVGDITIEGSFDNYQVIPVAAAVRLYPTYNFKLGADVGYAVGVNEGNDGGFYWRPVIGYNISGNTELNVSYININNDGESFSIAALGLLFLF